MKKESRLDQKMRTRRNLINVALQMSSEKGFSALSIREVAAGARITPAGFYRHFRDMEDLGFALLDEVGLILRRLLRDARNKIKPGTSPVQVSIETFLEFLNENGNLFRMLLGERQGASKSFRKAIHSEMDLFISELTEDLENAHTRAKKPLRNAGYAAEAIVAVVFTIGAEALDLPKHKQLNLADRLIEEVKMILRGSLQNK